MSADKDLYIKILESLSTRIRWLSFTLFTLAATSIIAICQYEWFNLSFAISRNKDILNHLASHQQISQATPSTEADSKPQNHKQNQANAESVLEDFLFHWHENNESHYLFNHIVDKDKLHKQRRFNEALRANMQPKAEAKKEKTEEDSEQREESKSETNTTSEAQKNLGPLFINREININAAKQILEQRIEKYSNFLEQTYIGTLPVLNIKMFITDIPVVISIAGLVVIVILNFVIQHAEYMLRTFHNEEASSGPLAEIIHNLFFDIYPYSIHSSMIYDISTGHHSLREKRKLFSNFIIFTHYIFIFSVLFVLTEDIRTVFLSFHDFGISFMDYINLFSHYGLSNDPGFFMNYLVLRITLLLIIACLALNYLLSTKFCVIDIRNLIILIKWEVNSLVPALFEKYHDFIKTDPNSEKTFSRIEYYNKTILITLFTKKKNIISKCITEVNLEKSLKKFISNSKKHKIIYDYSYLGQDLLAERIDYSKTIKNQELTYHKNDDYIMKLFFSKLIDQRLTINDKCLIHTPIKTKKIEAKLPKLHLIKLDEEHDEYSCSLWYKILFSIGEILFLSKKMGPAHETKKFSILQGQPILLGLNGLSSSCSLDWYLIKESIDQNTSHEHKNILCASNFIGTGQYVQLVILQPKDLECLHRIFVVLNKKEVYSPNIKILPKRVKKEHSICNHLPNKIEIGRPVILKNSYTKDYTVTKTTWLIKDLEKPDSNPVTESDLNEFIWYPEKHGKYRVEMQFNSPYLFEAWGNKPLEQVFNIEITEKQIFKVFVNSTDSVGEIHMHADIEIPEKFAYDALYCWSVKHKSQKYFSLLGTSSIPRFAWNEPKGNIEFQIKLDVKIQAETKATFTSRNYFQITRDTLYKDIP